MNTLSEIDKKIIKKITDINRELVTDIDPEMLRFHGQNFLVDVDTKYISCFFSNN